MDHLEAGLCIDRSLIMATGFSNGAMMVYQLAQSLPQRFAAIVPVAGGVLRNHEAPPVLTRQQAGSTALLDVHGVRDTVIPNGTDSLDGFVLSNDGWWYAPNSRVLRSWGAHSGCNLDAASRTWEPGVALAHLGVYCAEVGIACASGAVVVRCRHPGDHMTPTWTGKLSLEFLLAHPKRW